MWRLSSEALGASSDKIELGFVWSAEKICNDFPWKRTELAVAYKEAAVIG